jgi:hypothetical protein
MIVGVVAAAVLVVGCSNGPTAPDPQPTTTVCTQAFCLDVPAGWSGEATDSFIAFHHETLPNGTFLTANTVDMEAIATAAGDTWPVPVEDVVADFWQLLEDVDEGELATMERMVGGAWRSVGTHSTGDMWYLLVPVGGSVGVGVELRGPNATWGRHADVVFPSVIVLP